MKRMLKSLDEKLQKAAAIWKLTLTFHAKGPVSFRPAHGAGNCDGLGPKGTSNNKWFSIEIIYEDLSDK